MAKPTNLAVWATDTTNTTTGSLEVGQTVKLEPSTGIKEQGWIAGEEAPARWLNWWQNAVHAWILYLNGLPADAQFLANDFAWTGDNTFSGQNIFNGYTEVTGAVSNGNVAVNGTVFINTGGLTLNGTEGIYGSAKTRTKHAELLQNYQWDRIDESLATSATTAVAFIRLEMPEGATLQTVLAVVNQQTTPTVISMQVEVVRSDAVSNASNTHTTIGSAAVYGAGTGAKDLTPTFTPFTPNSSQFVYLRVDSSDHTGDSIKRVTYTYTETRATGS